MKRSRGIAKTAAIALVFVCLGLAAFIGFAETDNGNGITPASAAVPLDQIDSYKQMRAQLRAGIKAQLNDIAHDPSTEPELRDMARRELLALCTREEQELVLESILEMRGWDRAVVNVRGEAVNVILRTKAITELDCSMILEQVCRETGVQSGNVKIIPVN